MSEAQENPLKKYLKMFHQDIFNHRDEIEALTPAQIRELGKNRFTAVRYNIYKHFKDNAILEKYPNIFLGFGFAEFESYASVEHN